MSLKIILLKLLLHLPGSSKLNIHMGPISDNNDGVILCISDSHLLLTVILLINCSELKIWSQLRDHSCPSDIRSKKKSCLIINMRAHVMYDDVYNQGHFFFHYWPLVQESNYYLRQCWFQYYTVKPVYNDHPIGYFSAFWSSSRWPLAT